MYTLWLNKDDCPLTNLYTVIEPLLTDALTVKKNYLCNGKSYIIIFIHVLMCRGPAMGHNCDDSQKKHYRSLCIQLQWQTCGRVSLLHVLIIIGECPTFCNVKTFDK